MTWFEMLSRFFCPQPLNVDEDILYAHGIVIFCWCFLEDEAYSFVETFGILNRALRRLSKTGEVIRLFAVKMGEGVFFFTPEGDGRPGPIQWGKAAGQAPAIKQAIRGYLDQLEEICRRDVVVSLEVRQHARTCHDDGGVHGRKYRCHLWAHRFIFHLDHQSPPENR